MTGSDSDRLDQGLKNLLNRAIDLDQRGMKNEACQYYLKASKILIKLSNSASLPSVRKHYFNRAEECVDRVRYLSGIKKKSAGPVDGLSTPPKADITQAESVTVASTKPEQDLDDDEKKLREMISDTIITERPNVKMSEVAGLQDAKQAINDAIIAPLKHPELFKGKARQPWRGILFYGPAGCGKTNQPAIVFIDELDSIGASRSGDDVGGERRMKTQLLTELQGLASDHEDRVTVIGATNLPWEIDFALRSRFEKRIHVPLPDTEARAAILEIHMEDIEISPAIDFDEMADLTEGYSGRDISIVCREAAMEPIRDLQRTGRMDDEREILDIRPVSRSRNDFLSAIENIKPATPPEDVRRYIDWAEGS